MCGSSKAFDSLWIAYGFSRLFTFLFWTLTMEADKHKFQRFLTADAALVVTVFAPITFPPASVLLFKQRSNGMLNSKWYIMNLLGP